MEIKNLDIHCHKCTRMAMPACLQCGIVSTLHSKCTYLTFSEGPTGRTNEKTDRPQILQTLRNVIELLTAKTENENKNLP